MAHYRLQDRLPSVIVTTDGSERKVYENNTVYLNKGDNFELRFFNSLREKIGVEIIFNGQKKNDSLLVINPGEDISLDRFLDDKKRMIFDTYHIDSNNPDAVSAAALNGIIDINFYKEKINNNWVTFNSNNCTSGLPHFGNVCYTNTTQEYYMPEVKSKSLKETGRIEKGEVSNQNLHTVDIEFENIAFHSVQYYLKPQSTKTHTTTEIRNYCPRCNYRIRKSSWNYCPKCSQKF